MTDGADCRGITTIGGMLRQPLALAVVLIASACHSPTSPSDDQAGAAREHGRLSGVVTIGPNCPGPQQNGTPCPTPPSAYSLRKILVYNTATPNLLSTVD